jgi:hypothetical protein
MFPVRELPRALLRAHDVSMPVCSSESVSKCQTALTSEFTNRTVEAFEQLSGSLWSNLPVTALLFFVIIWSLVAQLLDVGSSNDTSRSPGPLVRPLLNLTRVGRLNGLLFILLGLAAYLSIAAIAAIPGLQDKSEVAAISSPASLRSQLAAPATLDVAAIEKLDPFADLHAALAGNASPIATSTANAATTLSSTRDRIVAELERAAAQRADIRQYVLSRLKVLSGATSSYAATARENAVSLYEQNLAVRKGVRERSDHFHSIITWYRAATARSEDAVRGCAEALGKADREAQQWSSRVAGVVRQQQPLTWQHLEASDVPVSRHYYDAIDTCRATDTFGGVPQRNAMGSDLGSFRILASWLLETESLPLAMIVGLMGFGLLGSACSTFVRERAGKPVVQAVPLVEDLAGVVIRGLSAAVVVFLAVEGGLAIFSSNTGDPNPYVLLLTCLIAAVFSESVWEWARLRLLNGLGGETVGDGESVHRSSASLQGDPAASEGSTA